MIKWILSDLSNTILFTKDKSYTGKLNDLHKNLLAQNPSYDFHQYFELDEQLLNFFSSLKGRLQFALFTSESIQESPAIKPRLAEVFDVVFSSKEIGFNKDDGKAYGFIAEKLSVSPDQILFIDDSQKNIDAAKNAGLAVWRYSDFESLKGRFQESLNE
jgi:HAD superfamily hydrolase (TIGR01509 family)